MEKGSNWYAKKKKLTILNNFFFHGKNVNYDDYDKIQNIYKSTSFIAKKK